MILRSIAGSRWSAVSRVTPSRSSCACAAIVCFSFATDSVEEVARRLRLVFLGGFLFIYKKPGWRFQSTARF